MLLQLNTSIEYNGMVRPICVDASVFPELYKCTVTGWGSTTQLGQTLAVFSYYLFTIFLLSGWPGNGFFERGACKNKFGRKVRGVIELEGGIWPTQKFWRGAP